MEEGREPAQRPAGVALPSAIVANDLVHTKAKLKFKSHVLNRLKSLYPAFTESYLETGRIVDKKTGFEITFDCEDLTISHHGVVYKIPISTPITFTKLTELQQVFNIDPRTAARIAILASTVRQTALEVRRSWETLKKL